jgi:hypothetical protein
LEKLSSVYKDDAKQNSFYTKSLLDATVTNFIKARPWLNSGRKAFVQSDNALNYRDPGYDENDLLAVVTRCFSEAGIGSDADGTNRAKKSGMKCWPHR